MKTLIVAKGLDGAIGKHNKLLWKLKDDMKHFVKMTYGQNVVMGSKTFESIGKSLAGRHNYVITSKRKGSYIIDDNTTLTFLTFEEFVDTVEDYIVIGGGKIYELFLPKVDKIYLTLVYAHFPEADVFMPDIKPAEWVPHRPEFFSMNENNEYNYAIVTMTRR